MNFFHLCFTPFVQDIFSGATHLSDSSTLILERVDRHHAGVYQCAADNGVREPVSMDINLTILCKFHSSWPTAIKCHTTFTFISVDLFIWSDFSKNTQLFSIVFRIELPFIV